MQFADLHIHSKFSDGILTPKEIINISIQKGLKYISITDHDTIKAQIEISKLAYDEKFNIIPGVEISTEYKNKEIHILGYFIDINDEVLIKTLNDIQNSRKNRAIEMINKLQELGIAIDLNHIFFDDVSIGRLHIANALVKNGLASNTKDAFHNYLMKGKPAYVDRYKIDYKSALKLICSCKGIPVLAHPGEIYKGIQIEKLIKEFKIYGLKGIEVFHPSHSAKEANDYYNLARKYSLAITGGSDCHGTSAKDNLPIGTCGLNENLTYKFLKIKSK